MKVNEFVVACSIMFLLSGCAFISGGSDKSLTSSYPVTEPEWIRDGQPIEFENVPWYPTDDVEGLLDSEVYQVGEYKGVVFFIDKVDVKPFDRIYTRFAKNRYRAFEKNP
jgi:hypothetical protein